MANNLSPMMKSMSLHAVSATSSDPPEPGQDRERRGIQSIEVGGEILKVLAADPRPMALKDLVKAAGMPSGKIHPYLVSFGKIGLVMQDPVTGHYLLGPLAIQLGLTSLQTMNPIREATPFVETLAAETGHGVALAVWGNLGPVIVRLVDASYPFHTNMRTGTVMSMANTATGRVFSAFLPPALVEKMLEDDRIRMGPDIAHPLDEKIVKRMIEEVRLRRMSQGINHPTPGIASFSAPVFDYSGNIALAVTISGPTGTVDVDWNGPVANALRACTDSISKRLGYRAT
jgi:DNA-binding IclR family transcriptional regulator